MKIKASIHGFTLLEILVVISLVGLITYYGADQYLSKVYEQMLDRAVSKTLHLGIVAQSFLVSDSDYLWPDQANNCADAITKMNERGFLFDKHNKNVWEESIVLNCPMVSSSSGFRPAFLINQKVPSHLANRFYHALPSAALGIEANGWVEIKSVVVRPSVNYQKISHVTANPVGVAVVSKPNCAPSQTAQISASPLSLCAGASKAMRGFLVDIQNQPNEWMLKLLVSDQSHSWSTVTLCDDKAISFQVVTVCG
jgi:prepilin-type N-terminal cleavage/methylation domain-containing protein